MRLLKGTVPCPRKVARALLHGVDRDAAEVVVANGPGKLFKLMADASPGMGPVMNRRMGVNDVMDRLPTSVNASLGP